MNREEAAREIDNTACCFSDKRFRDAMHMAADALRGPQPDPITGLMPCGCGNPAECREDYGNWCVMCTGCDMASGYHGDKQDAIDEWGTAMGWRANK